MGNKKCQFLETEEQRRPVFFFLEEDPQPFYCSLLKCSLLKKIIT